MNSFRAIPALSLSRRGFGRKLEANLIDEVDKILMRAQGRESGIDGEFNQALVPDVVTPSEQDERIVFSSKHRV
jgi:hypothetical protein